MAVNESTAINIKGGGDCYDSSSSGRNIPVLCSGNARPGSSRSRGKESKMHDSKIGYFVEHSQAMYRHTGFFRSQTFPNYRNYNRCLPDRENLQNVYLLREDSQSQFIQKRHYSTGDIQHRRESKDAKLSYNFRKWVQTGLGQSLPQQNVTPNGIQFKLMNYNVLAQDLVTEHSYIYRNHSPTALLWETRWRNLYKEITKHDADIICLQEVQETHIDKYYSRISELGYGSLFKKRTGYRTDGCAIYYRSNLFTLVDHITVEYYQPNTTLLDRENVAIVAILAPIINPKSKFVVATTHLLYNPRRQDIRVAQTQVLLTEIERMAFDGFDSKKEPKYLPIVVTGDFNSEPKSAVLELLVNGSLRYDNLAKRTLTKKDKYNNPVNSTNKNGKELIPANLRITDQCQHLDLLAHRSAGAKLSREEQDSLIRLTNSNQNSEKVINDFKNETLFSSGQLSHKLNLRSAFRYWTGNDSVGTTFQNSWITVDYIFYSGVESPSEARKNEDVKLKLLSIYSIPTIKQLKILKTIPNLILGSDHLALLTKFQLDFN